MKTLLRLTLVGATAVVACRSSSSGGRPTDGGAKDGAVDQAQPKDVYCAPDAMGGGQCPINYCGEVKSRAHIPQNESPSSGADVLCNAGRVCVVGPMLASNEGFQLVCQPPAGTAAFGAACTTGGGQCATQSLCVTAPDSAQPFCSMLCRNDEDCPVGSDSAQPARCLDFETKEVLTDGSHAIVGMCVPDDKIAGKKCLREADCNANEGCVFYAGRTSLRVCRVTAGAKSMGAACANNAECRSGECYDRNGTQNGGPNRTFCAGPCIKSSDCGADQRCVRLVVSNNGTPDNPLDDLVSGYCQALIPAVPGEDCQSDAHCTARQDGSDTCDVPHGLCYKKTAVPGSACARDSECMLGGICSLGPRFAGGYCQTFGCDPTATTGVDACGGTRSVCATRGGPDEPIGACYESCTSTTACSRAASQYRCESATIGLPANICLFSTGA